MDFIVHMLIKLPQVRVTNQLFYGSDFVVKTFADRSFSRHNYDHNQIVEARGIEREFAHISMNVNIYNLLNNFFFDYLS